MNLFSLGSFTWLWDTINGLFLVICNLLYSLIVWVYQVFVTVAKVNLFDRETFDAITGRIYVIIGVAMLFIFAYNIILLIINPDDKKSAGNNGKIIKETVISFVLIILLPTIFNWLYVFQNNVLDSGIIATVILGEDAGSSSGNSTNCKEGDYDCSCDFSSFVNLDKYTNAKKAWYEYVLTLGLAAIDDINNALNTPEPKSSLEYLCNSYKNQKAQTRGAYVVPPILMSAFYRPKNFTLDECVEHLKGGGSRTFTQEESEVCGNYFYNLTSSKYIGNIGPFVSDEFLRQVVSDSKKDILEFNWLMAVIAGALAVYMFFCYAMEIGVRVAKLGVLQIISPIPVMMRIIPKKKEAFFDKWLKQIIDTYLDVFIRLMIIYFSLFAISLVPGVLDNLFSKVSSDGGWTVKALASVFVILGILKFAQEAPALLKEFFGNSGKFALRSPAKQLSDNKLAMGAMGGIQGMASMGVKNRGRGFGSVVAGATSGMFRGARAGYKSQNFKDLKYNTSGAVDRAIKARDDRDYRKKYGVWDYRADELESKFKRWTSSDSYASLNAKSNDIGKIQKAHAAVIDLVEGKIAELPEAFSFNGRTYGYYKRLAEQEAAAANNFDAVQFEKDYRHSHKGATDEEVRNAVRNKSDELNLRAGAAAENARLIKEAIADAVIAEKGGKDGINNKPIKIEGMQEVTFDEKGLAKTLTHAVENGMVSTVKEVKGVSDKIDEASSLYDKNSSLLREETRNAIDDRETSIRKANGILKGELGHISSEISKLSELKKGDK